MPDDLTIVAQYVKSSGCAPAIAYNAACRLLDSGHLASAARDAHSLAEKLLNTSIDLGRQLGHAEACVNVLEADRDALRSEVARLRAANIEREAIRKATESHRGGRTPQTLGAGEGQAASGAQEAAQ